VGEFGCWVAAHSLSLNDISEKTIAEFDGKKRHPSFVQNGGETALRILLNQLRLSGVAPAAPPQPSGGALERIEGEFATHLRQDRALSEATVRNYCPVAVLFISERFGRASIDLSKLGIADIHTFVFRHAHNYSPKRVQLLLSALRSFLRFLYLHGKISLPLNDHVPGAPAWSRTQPPKWLGADDIEQVLNSCDLHSSIGQRDFAILLLLARLGLRAGEVVSLELDDIRWEAGEITVCGKGKQRKRFSLPEDVGQALASYLKNVRPPCNSRRVFIRSRAPYRGLGNSSSLDRIVSNALLRAGLDPPSKGAHLFRHSLATNMLRNGATLTEIGQILHHTNPDTTSIYAKVDITGLRALAQPWPGD